MAATFLPAPRHNYQVHVDEPAPTISTAVAKLTTVPPYGQRQSFVPRAQDDFGDGGAFPEIHVAQYPLEMGRPATKTSGSSSRGGGGGVAGISGLGNNAGSSAIVAVDVDEKGKVRGPNDVDLHVCMANCMQEVGLRPLFRPQSYQRREFLEMHDNQGRFVRASAREDEGFPHHGPPMVSTMEVIQITTISKELRISHM